MDKGGESSFSNVSSVQVRIVLGFSEQLINTISIHISQSTPSH
jgi:hypothetical protein